MFLDGLDMIVVCSCSQWCNHGTIVFSLGVFVVCARGDCDVLSISSYFSLLLHVRAFTRLVTGGQFFGLVLFACLLACLFAAACLLG